MGNNKFNISKACILKGRNLELRLLVLDGNSILNRAFYGVKGLSTKEGFFTNGIYGFLTTFQKVKEETSPDAIAIAFDVRKPTFRHEAYEGYKAKRKGMPDDLAKQLPVLKELLGYLGLSVIECEGFEADDILGTLAKECEDTGNECVIATGDRDSLQLVSENVSVRIAATKFGKPEVTLYDRDKIFEKYGVTPKQLIDIKAIQGDSSDNIPGVAGIGEKGASELIRKFNNLDYIYENIDTIDIKDGMRKKLKDGKESAYMSKMLGTIRTDVPIDVDINLFVPKECDKEKTLNLMAKLEFFSLIDKMGLRNENKEMNGTQSNTKYKVIRENISLENLYKNISKSKKVRFLAETDEFKKVILIAIITDSIIYVVSNAQDGFNKFVKKLFEDRNIEKQTHDIKSLISALDIMNVNYKNIGFDTMLAAYLLNPSASDYSLDRLCNEYGTSKASFDGEKNESLLINVSILDDIIDKLEESIEKNGQQELLRKVEIPLSGLLAKMENIGFGVDAEGIKKYGDMLNKKICEMQKQIYDYVGYEFNINSPKQLGSALFEGLGLPAGKKTKSGYSTNAEVLEGIRYAHPVVDAILEYRTLAKLKSTYCDGMLKVIEDDGRIHSKFNQVETRTGRISSTEPNLQNIPVKTDIGRELRRFFKAKEGHVLVDADYSQIELRVLAHVADDKNMIEAFKNNEDVHAITASQVFHIPSEMLTPLMRSRAKAVNFGIVYGISAFSLSKDIGVTVKEAKKYIDNYLSHYSGVDKYMKEIVEKAEENGYVETMFKRRRYLPELTSSNFNLRSFGKRVAMNMPIQGAAADIIKIAMIKVENRLIEENLKARLILQVHDELIVEAPENEAEKVANILRDEMESAVDLKVPLIAEASVGKTWYEAKV